MIRSIAIIGFGISGIAACRWAVHYGFQPSVFEKNSSSGGVWLTHNYPNCQLQTTRHSYHFSDLSMNEKEYNLYPSGKQVQQYLEKYIEHHSLDKYVHYNSTVQSVKKVNNHWELVVDNEKRIFNYLIISTGFYGQSYSQFANCIKPNEIIEPTNTLKDKQVVVIGNGPSGCDIACLAVESGAKSVVLLYRTPRWIFSRYFLLNFPVGQKISLHFFTWRFFLTIAYYLPRPILRLCLIILYMIPIFWYGSKLEIEYPTQKVNRDNLVLNDMIYYYISKGLIQMIRDPAKEVSGGFVITKSAKYQADIVVDATGYRTGIPLIGYQNQIPKLYRNIVIPGDDTCGFIGYVASFSWVQVSELQCHWFYQQLLGRFKLPEKIKQQEIIGSIVDRDYHDYAYLVYNYINLLRKDMGLRALNNWFSLVDRIIDVAEI